ncbi:hypothetical protein LZ24_00142 [Desulfobotulus alkaliphilus]|uniref:Uncharacterized protein n=1 Tax=Desulfobotulus alkaliphilus TaxID=622671 RepID=A0A562S7H1_9BACT|nr:hypothetical protein [Desulfobotulus alkaliphilus]TWI77337.1 hypothetical protein LZ24_00142 [Desulfobotulus alkaliphilus]
MPEDIRWQQPFANFRNVFAELRHAADLYRQLNMLEKQRLTLKGLNRIRVPLDDLCLPCAIDLVDYGNIQDLRVKAHR